MATDRMSFRDVIRFLDSHQGEFEYGELAQRLGTGSQAVGSMMRAIHNRGLHDYCRRVIDKKTRKHGCDRMK